MEIVKATELRKNLFALLEKVGAGEVILIEKNGHPIARLIPETNTHWQQNMKNKIEIMESFEELNASMEDVWADYV